MQQSKAKRLNATAHHEAGHAVARWWLGLSFREASIIPDQEEGTLGHVLTGGFPGWFNPELDKGQRVRLRVENEIVSLFAGQIAEAKFLGRRPRFGYGADNQQAVSLSSYFFGGKTLEAFLHFLWLSSETLVQTRWLEIEAVAVALVDGKKVNRRDIIAITQQMIARRAQLPQVLRQAI